MCNDPHKTFHWWGVAREASNVFPSPRSFPHIFLLNGYFAKRRFVNTGLPVKNASLQKKLKWISREEQGQGKT